MWVPMLKDDAQNYFRKKIMISLLGEPTFIPKNKVIELCERFFNYGIEYKENKGLNGKAV